MNCIDLIRKIKTIPGYPVTHPIYGDCLVSLNEKPNNVAIRRYKGQSPLFIESAQFFSTIDWTVHKLQCVDFEDVILKVKNILSTVDELKQRGINEIAFSNSITHWLREGAKSLCSNNKSTDKM
jgi:hypothetical protein